VDRETFASLLVTAERPHGRQSLRLGGLVARCWPGGSDCSKPAALAWVRGWGPRRTVAPAVDCGCAAGRCAWCN
jgi:hypothetical protein